MKKLSFFALAMAGMLFTACADKDVVVEDVSQKELLPEGYMSLSLNLPVAPVTRAVNDDFDDGKPAEYNVTDCALLLFQGKTEASATLINAQPILLPSADLDDEDDDNITASYKLTAKVENFDNNGENNLYVLALLNYKDVMTIDTDGMPKFHTKDGDVKLGVDAKLSDIQTMEINKDLTTRGGSTTKNYFFMTNALLSTVPGGPKDPSTGEIVQLAKMDPEKIFETKKQAEEDGNLAGDIIVERAVAKATLGWATGATPTIVLGNESNQTTLNIAEIKWAIDNMQPTTYVARNPGSNDYIGYKSSAFPATDRRAYRFVGEASVQYDANYQYPNANGHQHLPADYYRTYWCIDPLYDKNVDDEGVAENYMVAAPGFSDFGHNNPLYCYENTFDVLRQSYKNTTRAIIKVKISDYDTFYTVNGSDDILKEQEDATSYVMDVIANNTLVVDAFTNNLEDNKGYKMDITYFDVKYERNEVTGQLEVTSLALSDKLKQLITTDKDNPQTFKAGIEADFNANVATLIDYVNERVVIREYRGGTMYYEARFKHFAGTPQKSGIGLDDLAPWNIKSVAKEDGSGYEYENTWEGKIQSGDTKKSYPNGVGATYEENYLGRYGMVRNNWYYVEVEKFLKLGYPADPTGQVNNPKFDDPDTPDDHIDQYISAKIHILSWAKRMQSWSF